MRLLLIASLFLAAIPVMGGSPPAPPSREPIALYTRFQTDVSDIVFNSLRNELASLMAPAGMSFTWRDLAAPRQGASSAELAVIEFRGRCGPSVAIKTRKGGPLGWTHISDGVILPFSDIDCDAINRLLQWDLISYHEGERDVLFGRALARVLAHELYHIFARTPHHAACGVGRSAHSNEELLSDEFQFEASDSRAMQRTKPVPLVDAAPAAAGSDPPTRL